MRIAISVSRRGMPVSKSRYVPSVNDVSVSRALRSVALNGPEMLPVYSRMGAIARCCSSSRSSTASWGKRSVIDGGYVRRFVGCRAWNETRVC